MPTVSVKRDLLFEVLGKAYTDDEFDDLCYQFGLELDEVTTEQNIIAKEQGSQSSAQHASEEVIYKIDVPANRYDLLCLEGLSKAFLVYLEKCKPPVYGKVSNPKGGRQKLLVTPPTKCVRPFVVAAVLRGITFNQQIYNSFIDLQDKLHQNICRKRSLVSIGTHDLDTIQGPFTYDAKKPEDIKFVALNQKQAFTAAELMQLYSGESHLKPYLAIIKDKPVYPIIYDKNGTVLSFPPIINSEHSKITLSTRNVFIEITATDLRKANVVLDTMVTMFSCYCDEKFTVEEVDVEYSNGEKFVYPELGHRTEVVDCKYVNDLIGIQKSAEEISALLSRMCLTSEPVTGDKVRVSIPPTRHDVLHACDIAEDVAIAFGYNNIERLLPKTTTVGQQGTLPKLTDLLREQLAQAGYTEALTFSLCSREDISDRVRHTFDTTRAVQISNPKTIEFQVARTSLLPGLLKTLHANKKMPLPIKLFEISDVMYKDPNTEVGVRNRRYLCAVYYGKAAGFEIIHGLLDRVMQLLETKPAARGSAEGYYIQPHKDPTFFDGRCAQVVANGRVVGAFGIVHPEVVVNFDLTMACSAVEIDIEPFL